MSGKILPFSVPKSEELSRFLEEHVVQPSYGRLLCLFAKGVPDPIESPSGEITFYRPGKNGAGRDYVTLPYETDAIPMPEWYRPQLETKSPGDWFLLQFGEPYTPIPLRRYSSQFRVDVFCPHCLNDHYIALDEQSGEVVCRKCFNGDLFDSLTHHSRYSPIKRHSRPRCAVCGFRASSPVHNAGGGPETHLYRPAHRLNCDRAARTT